MKIAFLIKGRDMSSFKKIPDLKVIPIGNLKVADGKTTEVLLSQAEMSIVTRKAISLAKQLSKDCPLRFRDYDIWEMVEQPVAAMIEPMMRQISVMEKAIRRYQPQSVIAFDSNEAAYEIIRDYCKSRKIKVEIIRSSLRSRAEYCFNKHLRQRMIDTIALLRRIARRGFRNEDSPGIGAGREEILFVPYHSTTNLSIFLPVMEELKKRGQDTRIICIDHFSNSRVHDALVKKGIGHEVIERFYSSSDEKILSSFFSQIPEEKLVPKILYKGLDIGHYTLQFFTYYYTLQSQMKDSLRNVLAAERIVKKYRPSLIVTGEDRLPIGRAFILPARKRGIPSLFTTHGIPQQYDYDLWDHNIISDYVTVYGEKIKRGLISAGIEAKKIVVTGNPSYDQHSVERTPFGREEKKNACKTLGLDEKKRHILIATQMLPEDDIRTFLETACRAVKSLKADDDIEVMIKLHPLERKDIHLEFARRYRAKIFRENLFSLIRVSDCVITIYSSAALDALVMGKQLIVVDLWNKYPTSYVKDGLAYHAATEKELAETIRIALTRKGLNQRQWKTLEQYVYKIDGKSASRIAELMVKIKKGQKKQ